MFINVNEVSMFYDIKGEGNPLILVHGNGETHHLFDAAVEKLSKEYKVYLFDSRNHGESGSGKLSYELMADDYIQAIKALKVEKPIFFGFSDGGIIGLMIAIQEPELLGKLIVAGPNLNPGGLTLFWHTVYFFWHLFTRNEKIKLMLKGPKIAIEDLSKITVPTYVLAGEHDVIKFKHLSLIRTNIANSQLFVFPGESHDSYVINNEKLCSILEKIVKK